ncbi:MAG: hypothetical protein KGH64_04495 [Candidatus Micrarchaeota archaeon]|nr:hypothetical protein [Candidatus Micrarchaeota archaeon]
MNIDQEGIKKDRKAEAAKRIIGIMEEAKTGYDNYYWLMLVFITGTISIPLLGAKGIITPIGTFAILWALGHGHKKISKQRGEPGDLPIPSS